MKTKYTVLAAALISCGAFTAPAQAQTMWEPDFKFSGFGTFGAVRTDTSHVNFGRDRQSYGGATTKAAFDVDSNLGVQATATANKWLSGTVQVLSAKRTTEVQITTEAEWAFAKVTPIEGLSIRGGRMAMPLFLVSDSRNVGYANNWLRAPNEVYGLVSFRRLQGFDVSYQTPIGSTNLTVTALAGTSVTKYGSINKGTTYFDMKNVKGANIQLETDWATFRVGKIQAQYDTALSQDYSFTGFGVAVDRNNVVAQAEYVQKRAPAVPSAEGDGWYLMGGYRFGSLLPYASYASTKPKTQLAYSPTGGNTAGEQKTAAIGLRWDAFKAAALKFQLEHIDTNGSRGISFYNAAPTAIAVVTRPVTVASATIDFVF